MAKRVAISTRVPRAVAAALRRLAREREPRITRSALMAKILEAHVTVAAMVQAPDAGSTDV